MEEKKRERFTAFITKYALTRGIMEATVEDCFDISPDMVGEVDNRSIYYHGKDWHRTRQAALARVLEMIATKRKSLANSHRKLDALESHIRRESGRAKSGVLYPNQDSLETIGRPIPSKADKS